MHAFCSDNMSSGCMLPTVRHAILDMFSTLRMTFTKLVAHFAYLWFVRITNKSLLVESSDSSVFLLFAGIGSGYKFIVEYEAFET